MTLSLSTQSLSQIQGQYQGLHNVDLKEVENAKSQLQKLWQQKDEEGAFCSWLNLPLQPEVQQKVITYAQSVKGQYEAVVHIGIGGSCLGPQALLEALLPSYWNELSSVQRNGYPKFYFVDNVDSDKMASLQQIVPVEKTLFHIVTKSGGTMETWSAFLMFLEQLQNKVGVEQAKKQIVATTDPEKGLLRQLVNEYGWQSFEVAPDVGGRFSIFSPVGLLPAALAGIDMQQLCTGLKDAHQTCQQTAVDKNPALQAALLNYLAWKKGASQTVLMPYSAKLAYTADWFVQLWAESLGKTIELNGDKVALGSTPIRSVGVTDQHSQLQLFNEGPNDKLITLIFVDQTQNKLTIPQLFDQPALSQLQGIELNNVMLAEAQGTRDSLVTNQRPVLTWQMPKLDAYYYAQLLFYLQVQTALMGFLMGVNPFDQPGVELSKKLTVEYLKKAEKTPA